MHISAIEPQQKHKERVSIFLDGQFAFGLYMDVVVDYRLKVGQELSDSLVEELKTADAFRAAYDKALGYLAVRPRSEREVKQYLRNKLIYQHPDYAGISHEEKDTFVSTQERSISKIMQKLSDASFIDDAAFAKWWIDNRRQFRPRGKRLLLLELQAKGVSAQDIETALITPDETGHFRSETEKGGQQYDEAADAYVLAEKYARKHMSMDEYQFKQKVGRYLASKGYDWDIIEVVVKKLRDESD